MIDISARCFVGFDTSNYTTSAAVSVLHDGRPRVVANIKIPLPVSEGSRGLRQSDAVFAHVKNLPDAIREVRRVISEYGLTVAAVGYSATPRDAEGSYMPSFCRDAWRPRHLQQVRMCPFMPFLIKAATSWLRSIRQGLCLKLIL